jgi:hypothetical protein
MCLIHLRFLAPATHECLSVLPSCHRLGDCHLLDRRLLGPHSALVVCKPDLGSALLHALGALAVLGGQTPLEVRERFSAQPDDDDIKELSSISLSLHLSPLATSHAFHSH